MADLLVSSPATLLDLAELGGAVSRLDWAVLRQMHAAGRTWSVRLAPERRVPRIEGELVLLAGLYPFAPDRAEAWFNAAPSAGPHMLQLVHGIRLTLRAAPYREIVTICRSDAGRRIARAVGFRFQETSQLGEIWLWKASSAATAPTCASSRKPSSASSLPNSPASRESSTSRPRRAAASDGAPAAAS